MVISKRVKSKLKGLDDNSFLWLEEITHNKRQRLRIDRKYYRGFRLNSLTLFEGDCVLINAGIGFANTIIKFEIARILECYYEENENSKGFVKVQWYTPFTDIRKSHLKSFPASVPPCEDHLDVVKDMWSYKTTIDIETIFAQCCVIEVNAMVPPCNVQRPSNATGPLYVCRFMYIKNNPWLCPLIEDIFKIDMDTSLSTLKEVTHSPKNWNVSLASVKSFSSTESKAKQLSLSVNHSASKVAWEEKVSDSPKRRRTKRKLLDSDEDQENHLKKVRMQSSSPVTQKVDKTEKFSHIGKKEVLENSNRKNGPDQVSKIDAIKVIGQFRGLQSTEISDLLNDKEHLKGSAKRLKGQEMKEAGKKRSMPSGTFTPHIAKKKLASNIKEKIAFDSDNSEKEVFLSPRRVSKPTERLKSFYSQLRKSTNSVCTEKDQGEKPEVSILHKSKRAKDITETKKAETEESLSKSKRLRKMKKTEDENIYHKSKDVKKKVEKEKCILQKSKRKTKKYGDDIANVELLHSPLKEAKNNIKTSDKSPIFTPSKSQRNREKYLTETPMQSSHKSKMLSPPCKLPERNTRLRKCTTVFEQARAQLHVSAVPSFLPCREEEFQQIYSFVEGKVLDSTGGCMYISGVPGTGKTATVREVVRLLQQCEEEGTVPSFHFLEVNAMKLTRPHQLWVQIWEGLTSQRVTADHAYSLFKKSLASGSKRKSTFILLDELDLLWTRKQDVMYNLFDLSSHVDNRLIVVTIANTMDLPERMMISRVSSRLGLTRMTFQPYNFKQLEEIIASRLIGVKAFDPDAIQLVARKVAAVSGDARRALDVCRRATELAEQKKMELLSSPVKSPKKLKVLVGMLHVSEAINEMFSSPKITAIRCCSEMERYILQAILTEFRRRGIEDAVFNRVFEHLQSICRFEGICPPSTSEAVKSVSSLSSQKILITDHSRHDLVLRIRLNISSDDVSYALNL